MRNKINKLLFVLFFVHGLIYFVKPQEIYNLESPLKIIKYVICVLFILINVNYLKNKRIFLFILFLCIGLFVFSHDPSTLSFLSMFNRLLVYIMPLTVILVADVLDKTNLNNSVIIIAVVSIISTIIETYVFKGLFTRYNFSESMGFIRAASIFVNPNNAALTFSILFVFINERINIKTTYRNLLLLGILFSIYLTGSKTPIPLFSVYILFIFISKIYKKKYVKQINIPKYLILGLVVALVSLAFFGSNFFQVSSPSNSRELSLETGNIRMEQFLDFVNKTNVSNFISPNYYDFSVTYDLSVLQLWSDFSFIGMIVFFIYLFYMLMIKIKKQLYTQTYCLLFLIMACFSLHIFYIWPAAYLFWFIIFSNSKKTSLSHV